MIDRWNAQSHLTDRQDILNHDLTVDLSPLAVRLLDGYKMKTWDTAVPPPTYSELASRLTDKHVNVSTKLTISRVLASSFN